MLSHPFGEGKLRKKQVEQTAYSEDEIYDFLKKSITASGAWLQRDCFSVKESHITLSVPNVTVEKTVLSMHIERRLEEITGRRYHLECTCPEGDCELKALEELIESEESVFSEGIKIQTPVEKEEAKSNEAYRFGKDKFDSPTSLVDCRIGESVTITGSVFELDQRPIKTTKPCLSSPFTTERTAPM